MTERAPKRCIEVEVRRTPLAIFVSRGTEQRELADVAALIWRLSNGRRTLDEIVASVCETYDVDADTARRDAVSFLDALAADGFVSWPQTVDPTAA